MQPHDSWCHASNIDALTVSSRENDLFMLLWKDPCFVYNSGSVHQIREYFPGRRFLETQHLPRLMVGILYNLALSHMSPILEVMQYRKMHLKQ